MKLIQFVENETTRLGVWTEQGILDVEAAVGQAPDTVGAAVPITMRQALEGGSQAIEALRTWTDRAMASENAAEFVRAEAGLTFAPCISEPGKLICIGLNYRKHAEETNMPIPAFPILFNKFSNALAAHGEDIPLPRSTNKVDYEAELAIVIGKTAKYVSKEEALEYVFGYCAANDLSARDLQTRTSQWLAGKSCDKFAPIGPYVVTKEEAGDPNALSITCTVNGEVRQSSNTSDMIFDCAELVSYVSQCMTLSPGDIILTGTPEGVVFGYPPEKQLYLQPGDVVTVEIERLGALTNRIVSE
ncbi:fumarylacetoacetate hydrolase family protein [Paenibacillus sp. NEAU-GSW1]|uniref:fumarylacetoacetate hydrolase family protein n=1 Tax=Paenibacillus sp. NEAU-GSW1 TaxID=2682486 RepID=UPI0012E13C42|nr:fumarylacetoacetate hydrolase family protein [Paenibacillus sp. NEAU-GSW1]MUT67622.1 FAA hydrolase family protein [Paenibacillus sp. NEAU-GSW1]